MGYLILFAVFIFLLSRASSFPPIRCKNGNIYLFSRSLSYCAFRCLTVIKMDFIFTSVMTVRVSRWKRKRQGTRKKTVKLELCSLCFFNVSECFWRTLMGFSGEFQRVSRGLRGQKRQQRVHKE